MTNPQLYQKTGSEPAYGQIYKSLSAYLLLLEKKYALFWDITQRRVVIVY
jgi:hypothetical protein